MPAAEIQRCEMVAGSFASLGSPFISDNIGGNKGLGSIIRLAMVLVFVSLLADRAVIVGELRPETSTSA